MPQPSKNPSRNNPRFRKHVLEVVRKHEATIARSSPECLQVKNLVRVFGLFYLALASGARFDCILKWNDEGGMVPLSALANIVKNARTMGVLLRSEDIYPDFIGHGRLAPLKLGDQARWKYNIQSSQSTLAQKEQ